MKEPKTEIIKNYLHYRNLKQDFNNQNFWLIITAFLLLISLTMLTAVPWIVFHYISYTSTLGSFIMCIINLIRNRGIITPKRFGKEKCRYYRELDNVIDTLIKEDGYDFSDKSDT